MMFQTSPRAGRVGLAGRYQPGAGTSADVISSWHQLSLFPSASAQVAPAHAEDHLDFLLSYCKTSEPWARASEDTATHREMLTAFTYISPTLLFALTKAKG